MSDYLSFGITYAFVGLAAALLFVYVLRVRFVGSFGVGLILGLVGAFGGGVLSIVLDDLVEKLRDMNGVNVFPPVFGAFLLLALFGHISNRTVGSHGADEDDPDHAVPRRRHRRASDSEDRRDD